ncbi:DUF3606 domain-containing protein [Sphingomonas sp. ASY06-1R]|uniref:DUF3606 domain-containing protein n=1 Tax=Sphingomonas sp. ASY06-1R TaxID=3445771 RepID=UPI003FA27252
MVDTTSNADSQGRTRIALGDDHDVAYWTEKFGGSREELAAAVDAVGTSADAVSIYLGKAI